MWRTLWVLVVYFHYAQAYKAAVVHYFPLSGTTPIETIFKNLNEYRKHAVQARKRNVDIMVFPEYGLTTTDGLSNPEEYSINIDTSDVIKQLSNIARENHLYLIINLFEKIQTDYYNTNLVFNRNGTLILKYHKTHLFNEDALTAGSPHQNPIFSTDFGVTFGIFTCFDILFVNPSKSVLQGTNVTDVVFTAGWIPSNMALSIEQGYSIANKVNVLAANYGSSSSTSGTGIHLTGGKTSKMVTDSTSTKILIREVPRIGKMVEKPICRKNVERTIKNVVKPVKKITQRSIFRALDLTKRRTKKTICKGTFCCTFDIQINSDQMNSTDIYRLMIFEDSAFLNHSRANFRACTLMACKMKSHKSCGRLTNVSTKFKKILVKGHFDTDDSSFYRPVTLSVDSKPLSQITFCERNHGNGSSLVQLTSKFQEKVLIFGLFGRIDSETDSSSEDVGFYAFDILVWGEPYYDRYWW